MSLFFFLRPSPGGSGRSPPKEAYGGSNPSGRVGRKGDVRMSGKRYAEFFANGEHFTVEDYGENGFALYCEDSFVTELETPDERIAYEAALGYESAR